MSIGGNFHSISGITRKEKGSKNWEMAVTSFMDGSLLEKVRNTATTTNLFQITDVNFLTMTRNLMITNLQLLTAFWKSIPT